MMAEFKASPGTLLGLALHNQKSNSNITAAILRRLNHSLNGLSDANDFLAKVDPKTKRLSSSSWEHALAELERHHENSVHIIGIDDPTYPPFLRIIPAAPPLLFLRGNIDLINKLPGVAAAGTRKATTNGTEIARRMAGYLSDKGLVVVSGLALGIDAAAHNGTLQNSGHTIAVLAHGLHRATPKSNANLANQILELDGAWISEHPLGVEPKRHYFVPRNRIQIGLSAGSVIIESDLKSGSMTLAQYCLGQNRPLFAVVPNDSGNSLGLFCRGTTMLVRDEAANPIRSKEDYPNLLNVIMESREQLLAQSRKDPYL
jgi:DNA processing protein